MPRTPVYPTYTPPARSAVTDTYDSYEAEKNKSYKYVVPSYPLTPILTLG